MSSIVAPALPPRRRTTHDSALRVAVDAAGAMVPAVLTLLRDAELAAAARRDYDEAAVLSRLQGVVAPRLGGPLTAAECAPHGVGAQEAFFLANGFWSVILDTLPGAMLARAQAAWLRRELPARRAFEEDQMLAPIISAEARLNAESLKPQQLLNAAGEQVRRADGTAVSHGAYRTFFDCDALARGGRRLRRARRQPEDQPAARARLRQRRARGGREPARRLVRNGALLRDVGADRAAAGERRGLHRLAPGSPGAVRQLASPLPAVHQVVHLHLG